MRAFLESFLTESGSFPAESSAASNNYTSDHLSYNPYDLFGTTGSRASASTHVNPSNLTSFAPLSQIGQKRTAPTVSPITTEASANHYIVKQLLLPHDLQPRNPVTEVTHMNDFQNTLKEEIAVAKANVTGLNTGMFGSNMGKEAADIDREWDQVDWCHEQYIEKGCRNLSKVQNEIRKEAYEKGNLLQQSAKLKQGSEDLEQEAKLAEKCHYLQFCKELGPLIPERDEPGESLFVEKDYSAMDVAEAAHMKKNGLRGGQPPVEPVRIQGRITISKDGKNNFLFGSLGNTPLPPPEVQQKKLPAPPPYVVNLKNSKDTDGSLVYTPEQIFRKVKSGEMAAL